MCIHHHAIVVLAAKFLRCIRVVMLLGRFMCELSNYRKLKIVNTGFMKSPQIGVPVSKC